MPSYFAPELGGVQLSGAQVITDTHQQYIIEHVLPGMDAGIIDNMGARKTKYFVQGFLSANADTVKGQMLALVNTRQDLYVPSTAISGFMYAANVFIESMSFIIPAGRGYPYYTYTINMIDSSGAGWEYTPVTSGTTQESAFQPDAFQNAPAFQAWI